MPRNSVSLTGIHRIRSLKADLERIPRLLLIRLRSLGDSILVLPLLEALHSWRPDLHVDVLSEAPFVPVFSRHPAVHETLILKPRNGTTREGWTRPRALAEIRRRRYPAVLNLHGGTTSLLFTLASGSALRIGEESYRSSWAYNIRIPPSHSVWNQKEVHTAEHQLTLLLWLGLPIPAEARGTLYVDPVARGRVGDRLHRAGMDPSGYLLIHPTATLFTKQWEEKNFAQLGDRLAEKHALPVIFTAARHEAQVLHNIRSVSRRKHTYWSDLPLEELFALIEGCRLFIGNDSGPTHAAAALKKPVVAVWGSSSFVAWRPWKTDFELVRSDLPCMPCPGYTCEAFGAPKCILEITVERVFEACERLLARTELTIYD